MVKKQEIIKAESKEFNFHYADGTHALKDINIPLYEKKDYCSHWSIWLWQINVPQII